MVPMPLKITPMKLRTGPLTLAAGIQSKGEGALNDIRCFHEFFVTTFQKYFDSAAGKKHFWRQNSNRRKIEIQILRETEVCHKMRGISNN